MTLLQRRALGAGTLSLLLLVTVFGFQLLGGLAPCPLCLWQRWPHGIAVLAAGLILWRAWRVLAAVALIALLAGIGIAVYHAGIEWGFWPGPATCTAPGDVAGMSAGDLVARLNAAPVVRCDEVVWSFAGLSMAGWNAVVSVILVGLWWRAYASSSASQ